ncbi:MAG: NAD+ synthase (glutamine-hydrolysing) [Puniceicoccaceae bacterium 5H]|nr:MAG: NAD+ synthase (glutamine-hydrolysing) [Puniceicoccaceae bacterium 5H]
MKIGLAQLNLTVGDLTGNRERILRAYHQLVEQGAELVVFPELAATGYPPRDLLFKSRFVPDNLESLELIARETGEVPAVIGFVAHNEEPRGRNFRNSAAWLEGGEVRHVTHKCLLPNYNVFDEARYFEAATNPNVVHWKGLRIGLTICEDIWTGEQIETSRQYQADPLEALSMQPLDLLVNLSASPWHYGKGDERLHIVQRAAQKTQAPTVYVNLVGGNDELIFDGASMVVNAQGELCGGLASFDEALQVLDTEACVEPHETFQREELADIYDALVLGVRDYGQKTGFRQALLGLSGGIDSALTAVIAAEAFGVENVLGVSLPSSISSQHSQDDAEALARNLGIEYQRLPVADVVGAIEGTLAPLFEGRAPDVTEENIQARSRGLLLMALSNKFGRLLLTTGNKSEVSVGYCTLYGDMCGGLAVISDLPKTKVFALSRWINREREVIPENTIVKPPSAELRPDQKDEDSLPRYEILDEILRLYVVEGQSSRDIIAKGFEEDVVREVVRKVDLNEYKRKQMPPGLKLSPLAFGVGRRIPIVQRYVG